MLKQYGRRATIVRKSKVRQGKANCNSYVITSNQERHVLQRSSVVEYYVDWELRLQRQMDDITGVCHIWEGVYYQERWWCFVCNYIMHPEQFFEFALYKYIILQRSQKAVIPNKCKNKTSLKLMLTQFSVPSLWTLQLVNCTTPILRNKDKSTVETSAVKHSTS